MLLKVFEKIIGEKVKKKTKIFVVVLLFILATGCTKQLKDGKEVVQKEVEDKLKKKQILKQAIVAMGYRRGNDTTFLKPFGVSMLEGKFITENDKDIFSITLFLFSFMV
mgnify:CR=1 FL=1